MIKIDKNRFIQFSRRELLLAGAIAPFLPSCTTDISSFSTTPLPDLARKLGVCNAGFVIIKAGKPGPAVMLSGCLRTPPVNSDAIFQAASLTKPVAAFTALKLAHTGQLDLHTPVSHYLPDGYAHHRHPFNRNRQNEADLVPASMLARISVATLLNHSSGLPNWTSDILKPEFRSGEKWQYSGEGYRLLQDIICAVTGEDFETSVMKSVFKPVNMPHSALRLTDTIRKNLVNGSSWFQLEFDTPNAAASLYTTVGDYARFVATFLADSALVKLALTNPVTVDQGLGISWGYGWGIETVRDDRCLWHWGNNPGYRAFVMMSLSSGNGFVLLTGHDRGISLATPLARLTIPAEHGVFRFHMLD